MFHLGSDIDYLGVDVVIIISLNRVINKPLQDIPRKGPTWGVMVHGTRGDLTLVHVKILDMGTRGDLTLAHVGCRHDYTWLFVHGYTWWSHVYTWGITYDSVAGRGSYSSAPRLSGAG